MKLTKNKLLRLAHSVVGGISIEVIGYTKSEQQAPIFRIKSNSTGHVYLEGTENYLTKP